MSNRPRDWMLLGRTSVNRATRADREAPVCCWRKGDVGGELSVRVTSMTRMSEFKAGLVRSMVRVSSMSRSRVSSMSRSRVSSMVSVSSMPMSRPSACAEIQQWPFHLWYNSGQHNRFKAPINVHGFRRNTAQESAQCQKQSERVGVSQLHV